MYCLEFHWCQIDNGNCDGLCLPQKFGRHCQCPSHQIYDASLNKCKGTLQHCMYNAIIDYVM